MKISKSEKSFFRFSLQTKVVLITVFTAALVGALLASFQIFQNRSKAVEIAKDRMIREGFIIKQEIEDHGERSLEISKKLAIMIRIFDNPNRPLVQKIVVSFQKKNPEFTIGVRSPQGDIIGSGAAGLMTLTNKDHPTISAAIDGTAVTSIERYEASGLAIASGAPMELKTSGPWIAYTAWPLTRDFTSQLKKMVDQDIEVGFLPFEPGESIGEIISTKTEIGWVDSVLTPFKGKNLQNPFFTKEEKGRRSYLTYLMPLTSLRGDAIGMIMLEIPKSTVFSSKGGFQLGAFTLVFPLLMGTLIFLLTKFMITTPVIQLAKVAKTIAVGNYSIPIPKPTGDEIGQLSQALSDMRLKIENKTNEMTCLNSTLHSQKKYLLNLNEELKQKNEYIETLVTTVSHELRTPMSSILGFSELMLNRKLPATKQKMYLETIYLESKRLATILNDFLDLQKMESQEPGLNLEDVPMNEIIEMVLARFHHSVYSNHTFVRNLSAAIPDVMADRNRLFQCLLNLVSNAVKYSPKGGTVTLTSWSDGQSVLAAVEDEGLGIPDAMLDKLFTKFFRVDSSDHREIGGTGLGLALCKDIVQLHGGKIWVVSKAGEGSKFTFSIPLPEMALDGKLEKGETHEKNINR